MTKDWFAKWAMYSPEKVAVKLADTGQTMTYCQLNEWSNRLCHYFTDQYQLQSGDRIAILAENSLEHLLLFGVAQKTGCILVPLNYRLATAEIDYLLGNAQPKLVLYDATFAEKIKATDQFGQIAHHWGMEDIQDFCQRTSTNEQHNYYPATLVNKDAPIFLLYTSGTTGFPKGAIYTHKMLFWNSVNTAISTLINTESRTINCMPLFHTGGWNVLLTPFLHHGGYACLLKNFDAATLLRLMESEIPTVFMGVPTMLKMMADESHFDDADLSSLHYVIVGGEPMPIPLIEKWHEKGVFIRQGFGMTEAGPNLTSLHQDDAIAKKGSIGRPNFYVDIKIVDETGAEVLPTQSGELLLRGPMVTPGYWQNPKATDDALKDDWFHTGDRVRMDEDGYLYVVDRIKNMFISGGENVYPAEVERVLVEHPAVTQVAVVGVPDDKWGEVGKAFLVATNKSLTAADIIAFCQDQLATFKVPKHIVFLDELPKNGTGKIDKKMLRIH
ncbi:MAG: long-chain fatty acid--CoA ligase [Bacteroidota bacterium]